MSDSLKIETAILTDEEVRGAVMAFAVRMVECIDAREYLDRNAVTSITPTEFDARVLVELLNRTSKHVGGITIEQMNEMFDAAPAEEGFPEDPDTSEQAAPQPRKWGANQSYDAMVQREVEKAQRKVAVHPRANPRKSDGNPLMHNSDH